ncbi:quinone oxidoreductase family protein [Puia sp. P3]|uniref:quinone oxidoreductase family protein n=1 Tax=Puia sp. P3 TaxID=3423952 RepID=UPI003D66F2BA
MKAAVITSDEVMVAMKAVAIKHLDRSRAAGTHYSRKAPTGKGAGAIPTPIFGSDGVGLLPDGTRVYGIGFNGTPAKTASLRKDTLVLIPDGLDDATAAALPNAVIGSAMGLRFKAAIQPGDTVLVNGATGFTGRIAVQIAKHYGAARVIATGRNPESLNELAGLGADQTISLSQADFQQVLAAIHAATPIDIVIDYLWGHSAEMILGCLKGNGGFTNFTRYVSVGSMSGDAIQLYAASLRSANLQHRRVPVSAPGPGPRSVCFSKKYYRRCCGWRRAVCSG